MAEYPRLLYRGKHVKRVESAEEEAAAVGWTRTVSDAWFAVDEPSAAPIAALEAAADAGQQAIESAKPKRKGRR